MQPITQAEFARLKGVSQTAVKKAIDTGRLSESLVHGMGKKARLNPILAAQEWEKNTDHSRRTVGEDIRPPKESLEKIFEKADEEAKQDRVNSPLNSSRAVREAYMARLAKLAYEEKSGKLIDAEEVKSAGFKLGRTIREGLLNIPDRLSSELAGVTDPAKIHIMLTQEITKALEVLSRAE